MSDREALGELQADMAEHQRRFGGEVTAEDNRVLVSAELERIDRIAAETPAPMAAPPEAPAAPPPTTIAMKEVDGRRYLMKHEADRPLVRVASPIEAEFIVCAEARMLQLLELGDSGVRGAASWRDRVLAATAIKSKSAAWKAAAEAPEQLAETRRTCEKNQALLRVFGLETISQLTPAFCRAKQAELEQRYLHEFIELLEDSNRLFGDWKNPPTTPVMVGA